MTTYACPTYSAVQVTSVCFKDRNFNSTMPSKRPDPTTYRQVTAKRDTETYRRIRERYKAVGHDTESWLINFSSEPLFQDLSSNHARKCVIKLLKNEEYASQLDGLLANEGLRSGFLLKVMHKVVYQRCKEVCNQFNHQNCDSKTPVGSLELLEVHGEVLAAIYSTGNSRDRPANNGRGGAAARDAMPTISFW